MVLGVVASDRSKMPPCFFKVGEKIRADVYYKILRYTVLPWVKKAFLSGNYVWIQDGLQHTQPRRCRYSMRSILPSSG
jgi:hypothetical protein